MPKEDTLKKLLSVLDTDGLTRQEFLDNFKFVLDYIRKIEQKNIKDLDKMQKTLNTASNNLQNSNSNEFNSLKGEVNQSMKNLLLETRNELNNKVVDIDKRLAKIKDGKDADEEKIVNEIINKFKIPTIEELKDDLPKMGTQVRDSLELLKGDERLEFKAIKGLEKKIKEIEKKTKGLQQGMSGIYQQGGSSSGGKTVKALDLSSQLNGSKRSFDIPTVWRVISVHLTSSPTVMREGIDYTWTPNNITLTSEVSNISLSSGQTLLITVAI